MTRKTVNRRLALVVAIHAEAHRVLDVSLRHGLLCHVPMTCRALDLGTNVRRVIEADMIVGGETVHALPREIESFVAEGGDLLDPRPISGDRLVADHAG